MHPLHDAVESTARAAQEVASRLAETLAGRGMTVGTAESLTGGMIASVLAAAPDAGTWLRGGLVAYSAEVKVEVLDVEPGPVVTRGCAIRMAESAATLLGADLCVAVTGVGGPDPDEGEPPGTVWFAVRTPSGTRTEHRVFGGDPSEVIAATVHRAIELLEDAADA